MKPGSRNRPLLTEEPPNMLQHTQQDLRRKLMIRWYLRISSILLHSRRCKKLHAHRPS